MCQEEGEVNLEFGGKRGYLMGRERKKRMSD